VSKDTWVNILVTLGGIIVASGFGLWAIRKSVTAGVVIILAGGIGLIGATLLVATIFVIVNLGVDLLYAVVDPRIRYR